MSPRSIYRSPTRKEETQEIFRWLGLDGYFWQLRQVAL